MCLKRKAGLDQKEEYLKEGFKKLGSEVRAVETAMLDLKSEREAVNISLRVRRWKEEQEEGFQEGVKDGDQSSHQLSFGCQEHLLSSPGKNLPCAAAHMVSCVIPHGCWIRYCKLRLGYVSSSLAYH